MNFIDFKKNFGIKEPAFIYLFEGEDVYFRNSGIEALSERYVTQKELNFTVIDGETLSNGYDYLFTQLYSVPFMSEKRIVLLKEFYPKAENIKGELKNYFEQPVNETIFIISNGKASDLLKKQKNVEYVDCKRANVDVLIQWITSELTRKGFKISSFNAKKIAEYSLCDMTKIVNEVNKLTNYASGKSEITESDVELLVVKDTEYQIFQMTELIGKKDFDKAIKMLNEMLATGNSSQFLMVSIYNYFRRLLHISISDKSDVELAKEFSTHDFVIKKARAQSKNFKKKSLKNAVDTLAKSDYMSKNGASNFDTALMISIFKILTDE